MGVDTYYEKLTGLMLVNEDQAGLQPEELELANKQHFKENFTQKKIEESVDKIKAIKEDHLGVEEDEAGEQEQPKPLEEIKEETKAEKADEKGDAANSPDPEADDAADDDDSDDESQDDDEDQAGKKETVCLKGMTKEEKKAHKARVKEDKREKRKEKMSKYDKKKAMNKGKFKK